MCPKILKSCCKVEFIHKDDNTLNYRRHKSYTGLDIVMIFLLFSK